MHEPLQVTGYEVEAEHRTAPGGGSDTLASSFDAVRKYLRRQWRLLALALVIGPAVGAGSLVILPVKYQAEAILLIDKQRVHFFSNDPVVSDTNLESNAALEGQLELLKSDIISKRVIEKLELHKDPDFALPQPSWSVLAALGFGQAAPLSAAQRERFLLDVFARNRSVKRLGAAFAVEIGFKSHSATLAATVANTIAETYIADLRSGGRVAAQDAGDWLKERLAELRIETAQAEQAVVEFKAKHDIIDTGGKRIAGQQVRDVSTQLTQARAHLGEVTARLERAKAAAREYATSTVKPVMTEMLNSSLANKLVEQYLELSNRHAEYAERFGTEHNASLRLQQRMEELKTSLLTELERLAQSFVSEKTILEKRVADLEAALKSAAGSARDSEKFEIKLRELETVAQSYRTLYDGLLRRQSEVMVQQEQPTTGARIISPAIEPISKVMKKPLLLAAILALGTTGIGVALSLLRDIKDRTFRTAEDIEQRLKSDFIGMIPVWRPGFTPSRPNAKALVVADQGSHSHVKRSNNAYWAFTLSPASAFAEAIGRVRFAILRNANVNEGRIVGFTSVLPNEGASTIAAAAAQSFAKSGRRVIIVDADLRHPELTREFAPDSKIGLQELLLDDAPLEQAILTDPVTGFAFLPGILSSMRCRPEELLETEAMAAVLHALRQRYDVVIVDLPPMFPMIDVALTERLIEAYVVVVEWGASKIDTVAHALARCPGVRQRMLGFVLNKVDFGRLSLYDHRAADYYDTARYSNYQLRASYERRIGHS